mgnify:CR=1 FL=1
MDADVCISILLARSTTFLFTGLSIIILSASTLERYLRILHPNFHRTRLTKKAIVTYVIGGILVQLSLLAASIFLIRNIKYASIGIPAIFFIYVAFSCTRIYLVIRRITRVSIHDKAAKRNHRCLARETKHCSSLLHCRGIFCFVYNSLYTVPNF